MIQHQAALSPETDPSQPGEAGLGNTRRFLWLFLPSWLLLTALFVAVVVVSLDDAQETRTQTAVSLTHHLEHFVRTEVKALVSDALLLRAQPDLQTYLLDGSPRAVEALAQSCLAFCQGRPALRQVKLLDSQGRQLLQVEANEGRFVTGQAGDAPRDEEYPLLAASVGLAANEIIISSRWLPPSPAGGDPSWSLDLLQPVVDGSGRRRGTLAASYSAQYLLQDWPDEPAATEGDLLMISGEGLCLYSALGGVRTGQALPELRQRMETSPSGHFQLDGALYVYTTILPMLEALRHSTGADEALLTSATAQRLMGRERWRLVVRQPLASWPGGWLSPLRAHLPWYLALSLALGVLGWAVAQGMVNREEKAHRLRLAQERSRISSAFEHAAIGMAVVSLDGRVLEANRYLCHMLGRERQELLGQGIDAYLSPEDSLSLRELLTQSLGQDDPILRRELMLITAGGQRRWAALSVSLSRGLGATPLHLIVHALDITENKRIAAEKEVMEAELLRAQKLEAIGILAGGVAHDFNNILGIICANAEVALRDQAVRASGQARRCLERLLKAGERGRGTVAQILSFCQPQDEERLTLDLAAGVADNLKLLEASLPKNLRLETSLGQGGVYVSAAPGEIQQIITNLAVNASQAIGAQPGAIRVSVERVELAQPLALAEGRLEPGPWVRLSVRDNGCGMDPDTLERIFDPFFTTKEKGRGTGLGLTTLQRIVGSLGGGIAAVSSRGQGSTFHVYLPPAPPPAREESAPPPEAVPCRQGRLLVVDDEADFLAALRESLEMHGYQVTAFSDPELAWREFEARPRDFCALVSDNHMESMAGTELARRVNLLRADLPIILCSGSYQDLVFASQRAAGVYRILRKPFSVAQLLETLGEALAAVAAQGELFPDL